MLDRALDLAVAVSLTGKAVDAAVLAALRDAGLPGLRTGHGYVIQRLVAGPETIGDIAQALGVSQQSVSRSVGELTDSCYVHGVADPDDRRRRLQQLTPEGLRVVEVARRARSEIVDEVRRRAGDRAVDESTRAVVALLDVLGVTDEVRRRAVRPDPEAE